MKHFTNILFILITSKIIVSGAGAGPDLFKTLADIKLNKIVEAQNSLFEKFASKTNQYTDAEREQAFDTIFRDYELFITNNPKYIHGDILYGKLLRQVGLTHKAHSVFLAAEKKDPKVAVIKQQIGNYLAEQGEFALALVYFLKAIELEPSVALYHYQLGELLHHFKKSFVANRIFIPEKLDNEMLNAFYKAGQLDSAAWIYKVRYAEAFFDIDTPRWEEALSLWKNLESSTPSIWEKEFVLLNQARILIELKKFEQAKERLAKVFSPNLEKSRRQLLASIPNFKFY